MVRYIAQVKHLSHSKLHKAAAAATKHKTAAASLSRKSCWYIVYSNTACLQYKHMLRSTPLC